MMSRAATLRFVGGILAAPSLLAAAFPNGDSQIRAWPGKSEIVITTTTRLAGAIQSLTWDGVEFINSTDHGRELQSACSFDNSPAANPETFNPTEAGSRKDSALPASTSRLLEIAAAGNHLRTRTQMAFWLAPGDRSEGQVARNTNSPSNYVLTKDVRIGFGRWRQARDYRVTFTVPKRARHISAQFEALTGYMPPEFGKFWHFNSLSGKLEPLNEGPGEIKNPVVFATADGLHAMGILRTAARATRNQWAELWPVEVHTRKGGEVELRFPRARPDYDSYWRLFVSAACPDRNAAGCRVYAT